MRVEQGIALRAPREQDSSNDVEKNSDTCNYKSIATLGTVLIEYLEKGLKTTRWYHGKLKMT